MLLRVEDQSPGVGLLSVTLHDHSAVSFSLLSHSPVHPGGHSGSGPYPGLSAKPDSSMGNLEQRGVSEQFGTKGSLGWGGVLPPFHSSQLLLTVQICAGLFICTLQVLLFCVEDTFPVGV